MPKANKGLWQVDKITLVQYRAPVVIALAVAASKNAGRNAVKYAREELRKGGHFDTGLLSHSIKSEIEMTAFGPAMYIYSDVEYSRWVNDGTGVFGPYGNPIVSPGGGVMKFMPGKRNSGVVGRGRRASTNDFGRGGTFTGFVYAYSVQGQPATKFMDKAMARVKVIDFIS